MPRIVNISHRDILMVIVGVVIGILISHFSIFMLVAGFVIGYFATGYIILKYRNSRYHMNGMR